VHRCVGVTAEGQKAEEFGAYRAGIARLCRPALAGDCGRACGHGVKDFFSAGIKGLNSSRVRPLGKLGMAASSIQ